MEPVAGPGRLLGQLAVVRHEGCQAQAGVALGPHRLDEAGQARRHLGYHERVVRVGLHLSAVHLDGLRHRPGRDEPARNAHVVGDCEEQGGHAARLVDHDHGPSDAHELSEGVADLALVLPDLRVQQNFARSPVDRREVMRPLAHVNPAADIELSFHSAPFVREELAFGHGTNHGITLREQAAPSAPRHQPIGYQSAPANPAA